MEDFQKEASEVEPVHTDLCETVMQTVIEHHTKEYVLVK